MCKRPLMLLSGIVVLLVWMVPASAQEGQAVPIAVTHSGRDDVGRVFVGHLKEALRQSGRYSVVESEENAALTLRISTLDPSPQLRGVQSIAGWSLLLTKRNGAYLSGGVRSFGADHAKDSAKDLAVVVDTLASRHRREIPGSIGEKEAERAWDAIVAEAAQKIRSLSHQRLFVRHLDLQRTVFQLTGSLPPEGDDLKELATSMAGEYDECDAPCSEALALCRSELAALRKATQAKKK